MADPDNVAEKGYHYLVMIVFIFLSVNAVQTIFGDVAFWIELLVAIGIVSAYIFAIQRFDIGPKSWRGADKP